MPYHRLRARQKGRNPSHKRGGHNKKLAEPQDNAVKSYLLLLYGIGTPGTVDTLILASNRVLYYTGSGETVSRQWAKRWIIRNSAFWKTLRSKPIAIKRRDAHKLEDIKTHFREFERCLKHWTIQNEDIYNFDETGFQIGVVSGSKVLVPIHCEVVYASDPDNKELVTAVVTLNYAGKKVPPMIIFKGAYHLRKHFDNDLDPNTYFARSENGFTTDYLGLKYIEHFNRFTKANTVGRYRLLIFDGHGSHVTQNFVDFCWEHQIQPYLLIPHLTHLLQPLDVGVFQYLKSNFKKAIQDEVFMGAKDISKVDFFRQFQQFYNRTLSTKLCYSAFAKTGLIPLNPDIVIVELLKYQTNQGTAEPVLESESESEGFATPPPTTPPPLNWMEWPTPLTLRTRQKGVDYIQDRQSKAIMHHRYCTYRKR